MIDRQTDRSFQWDEMQGQVGSEKRKWREKKKEMDMFVCFLNKVVKVKSI